MGATSIDLVFIKESEETKLWSNIFVETQTPQKAEREENVIEVEK
jgi:hypothetical protein